MKRAVFTIIIVALTLFPAIAIYIVNSHLVILGGRTIQVDDATQRRRVILSSKDGRKNVHAINIFITGQIDGEAFITQSYEEKQMYSYHIDRGRVFLPIGGDWYSNTCLLEYEPINVKSGKLSIRYRFHAL